MNLFSLFVMFLIIWWVVLFGVLPLSITGQAEADDITPGSEPGAPVDANIKAKFWLTTKIALVVWIVICAIIWSGLFNWDTIGEVFGFEKVDF